MTQADNIRLYAERAYIKPARQKQLSTVTIRAGDVHRDMGLMSAMPAVCSALGGTRFELAAGVKLVNREGPKQGANVYFMFALNAAHKASAYAPPVLRGAPSQPADFKCGRKSLALVSCVKTKLNHPARAKDLYVSPLFLKMRAVVESRKLPWQILSAKYGLVDPEAVVDPYEVTLNRMSSMARREWAARVLDSLTPHLPKHDEVIFFAGANYRALLSEAIERRGVRVQIPMAGLTLGQQLQWLSQH